MLQLQVNLRSSMKLLDIGVLAEKSGIPPSALRYYEEIGLIHSVARQGLRRQFSEQTLTQLALISLGKSAGFSLNEIKGMLGKEGLPELPREVFHQRADKLDQQILELTALSHALRHVAQCPAESHMACPKFRRLLRQAIPSA